MSFSTDWDIEKYRVGYESEEHWELRKKFLITHKNKYPEDKLVCLAQVFYNVEFLGCRYPKATMQMVENLSKGVVEEHREKMQNRLKRTFVGASDAASSKVKGPKRSAAAAGLDNSKGNSNTPQSNLHLIQSKHIRFEPASEDPPTVDLTDTPTVDLTDTPTVDLTDTPTVDLTDTPTTDTLNPQATSSKSVEVESAEQTPLPTTLTDNPAMAKKKKRKKKKKVSIKPGNIPSTTATHLPAVPEVPEVPRPATSFVSNLSKFQDVVLYFREEDNPKLKIQSSCAFSKVPLQLPSDVLDKSCLYQSSVKVCGVEVGSGTGSTLNLAQESASSAAVNFLSKHCYTILIKNTFVVGRKVERHEIMDCLPGNIQEAEAVSDDKASRMMKKMGWLGGGLGKEGQGRTEPVMPVHQSRRAGVGSTVGKIKFNNLKRILQEFMQSGSTHDIVFSTDFDNAERKEIHTVAHRFGLKSHSRSKGENRFLVVSRKWTPKVLLSILRDTRNKSEKYVLLPPNSSEEVAAVSQQQRIEESLLRDLQEERDKVVSEEQRTLADQAVASHEYEKKLSELEEEMNKHREAVIISEADKKVLAALRDLVAKKENELAALRREKQWTPGAELFCGAANVNSAIVSQIISDVEEASTEVEELKNELQRLQCKRIEADKIMDKIRAYTGNEKNAKLDMECRISAMREEKEAVLTASEPQQVHPMSLEGASSFEQSESRSAMLKELEEEKIRGANLKKEISEVMELTAKYAAERQEWLKKQLSHAPSENGK